MTKYFFTGLLILMAQNILGQGEWSLDQCIEYALEHNIDIKQQKLNAGIAEYEYDQSKYEIYPSLNAGLDYNFIVGRTYNTQTGQWLDMNNHDASINLSSNLVLFHGLTNYHKKQRSQYELLNTLSQVRNLENEISMLIAISYLQILFNQEMAELARNQLKLTTMQVERMEKRVEIGDGEKNELYSLIAQRSMDHLKVTEAQNQVDLSLVMLKQLLDLDTVSTFGILQLEDEMTDFKQPIADSVYQLALNNLPLIESATYQVNSAEQSLAIAKGERLPRLSLNFDYLYYNRTVVNPMTQTPINPAILYPVSNELGANHFWNSRVNLSVPIYNRNQMQTKIDVAQLMLVQSKLQLEKSQQRLYKDMKQLCLEIAAAAEKNFSAGEAVVSAQEAINYAQEKYEVGMLTTLEFNEAKNMLLKAQSDLVQAKYEYVIKSKILQFYTEAPANVD